VQFPQWLSLNQMSVQAPLQRTWLAAQERVIRPDESRQVPMTQELPGQTCPQAPQLAGSAMTSVREPLQEIVRVGVLVAG
jgi:hypothetical protein